MSINADMFKNQSQPKSDGPKDKRTSVLHDDTNCSGIGSIFFGTTSAKERGDDISKLGRG
jgi:hypothetical protein